jgi:hypothetical protein
MTAEKPTIDGYDVTEDGERWILCCQRCHKAWTLPKDGGEMSVGNSLYLLNHAASHEQARHAGKGK